MADKVPFVVAALGLDAHPFMLHLYAAFADKERSLISHPRSSQGARRGARQRNASHRPSWPGRRVHQGTALVGTGPILRIGENDKAPAM
jgi:hypothetical protein